MQTRACRGGLGAGKDQERKCLPRCRGWWFLGPATGSWRSESDVRLIISLRSQSINQKGPFPPLSPNITVQWLRLCFWCRGYRFNPWSGNENSTCHAAQPKKIFKEKKWHCRGRRIIFPLTIYLLSWGPVTKDKEKSRSWLTPISHIHGRKEGKL